LSDLNGSSRVSRLLGGSFGGAVEGTVMSSTFIVYVGPYAEWILQQELGRTPEVAAILGYETGAPDELEINDGCAGLPKVARGGEECWCLCCYAYFSSYSVSKPPRKLIWAQGDKDGVLELSRADPAKEIAWFESTYRKRLERLADHVGAGPVLGWGVVSYTS
jgi:hypothetical protein